MSTTYSPVSRERLEFGLRDPVDIVLIPNSVPEFENPERRRIPSVGGLDDVSNRLQRREIVVHRTQWDLEFVGQFSRRRSLEIDERP